MVKNRSFGLKAVRRGQRWLAEISADRKTLRLAEKRTRKPASASYHRRSWSP